MTPLALDEHYSLQTPRDEVVMDGYAAVSREVDVLEALEDDPPPSALPGTGATFHNTPRLSQTV